MEDNKNPPKNLGFANGWKERPKELEECKAKEHNLNEKNLGRCWNEYHCPICNITFQIDSSD
jgi:hypothetical protein